MVKVMSVLPSASPASPVMADKSHAPNEPAAVMSLKSTLDMVVLGLVAPLKVMVRAVPRVED